MSSFLKQLSLEPLFSERFQGILWFIVLSIYIVAYISEVTWFDNYAVYVMILFFMASPIVIPLMILPRLMKLFPILYKYISNDSWAIMPILSLFTFPIGLLAMIVWTVMTFI